MKAKEAADLGKQIADIVLVGKPGKAYDLLKPVLAERTPFRLLDRIGKPIGWGLKTLGKYYPDLLTIWLEEQTVNCRRKPRAVMIRKALTYLSDVQRTRATGGGQ